MSLKIYLNGKWVLPQQAKLSVFDHGVLYGDGVFEGIRAYNGLVFKLSEHIQRLWESAHTLMLSMPLSKKAMEQAVIKTLQKNRLKNAYIRVVVTRGVGDLGLDPRKCPKPSVFIITDKIRLYPQALYRKGLEIISVATTRNIPEAVNPQIKSLNYLNNILAKIEAIHAGYEEALLLSASGYVCECTGENIFLVKDGCLITPPAYLGILKGITRNTVMDIGRSLGLHVKEEVFTRHDVYNAEEVFLTGTAAEIMPISKVDHRVIGNGKPGPVTAQLLDEFRKITQYDGVQYDL